MDPGTVQAIFAALKLKDAVLPSDSGHPRFGFGSPAVEYNQCETVDVFMVNNGQASTEKRRAQLPKDTTLKQARAAFGKQITQQNIHDENDFIFADSDTEKPLWNFSNQCRLLLSFKFDSHLGEIVNKTYKATDTLSSGTKSFVDTVSNVLPLSARIGTPPPGKK